MLQENAFLCTLSSEKINGIDDDSCIKANVFAAVYNDNEEIYERSSYCSCFSAWRLWWNLTWEVKVLRNKAIRHSEQSNKESLE